MLRMLIQTNFTTYCGWLNNGCFGEEEDRVKIPKKVVSLLTLPASGLQVDLASSPLVQLGHSHHHHIKIGSISFAHMFSYILQGQTKFLTSLYWKVDSKLKELRGLSVQCKFSLLNVPKGNRLIPSSLLSLPKCLFGNNIYTNMIRHLIMERVELTSRNVAQLNVQ